MTHSINPNKLAAQGLRLSLPTQVEPDMYSVDFIEFRLWWTGEKYEVEFKLLKGDAIIPGPLGDVEEYGSVDFASTTQPDADGVPQEYILRASGGAPIFATKNSAH